MEPAHQKSSNATVPQIVWQLHPWSSNEVEFVILQEEHCFMPPLIAGHGRIRKHPDKKRLEAEKPDIGAVLI